MLGALEWGTEGSPVRFMMRPSAPAGPPGRAPGTAGFCAAALRLAGEAVWMPLAERRTAPLAVAGAAGRGIGALAGAGCLG